MYCKMMFEIAEEKIPADGIKCYSCDDEEDNEACNSKPEEICPHNKQVRYDV